MHNPESPEFHEGEARLIGNGNNAEDMVARLTQLQDTEFSATKIGYRRVALQDLSRNGWASLFWS